MKNLGYKKVGTLFFVECEDRIGKLVFDLEKRDNQLYLHVMLSITGDYDGYPHVVKIDYGETQWIPAKECKFNENLYFHADSLIKAIREKKLTLDDLKILKIPERIFLLLRSKY